MYTCHVREFEWNGAMVSCLRRFLYFRGVLYNRDFTVYCIGK